MPAPTKTPVRAYGPAQLPSSSATAYTVPAGKIAVIRHIRVSNPTGGALTFTMSIGADAAGTRLISGRSVAAGADFDHIGYWVLSPGEILAVNASAGASLVMAVFGDEYGGTPGNTGVRTYNYADAATSLAGQAVVASATPHNVGAWVEMVTSAPFTAQTLIVKVIGDVQANGINSSCLLDIAFGAGGAEVVKIDNLTIGFMSKGAAIPLNFEVPAGTRVAYRIQGAPVSQSVSMGVALRESGDGGTVCTAATTYNANTATSNATTVPATPGGANSEGAWTEITASTSAAIRKLLAGMTGPNATSHQNGNSLVDIGVGAGGSEVAIIEDLDFLTLTNEQPTWTAANIPLDVDVPAGSRLSYRIQMSTVVSATVIKPNLIPIGFI